MSKRILFLGYDEKETRLIDVLRGRGAEVDHSTERLGPPQDYREYDLVVSYGFRHIIPKGFLVGYGRDIINLHISYLPFNRGAHPNFWSFYDGTPSGVTIHLIDEGIDTGPILYQKRVIFADEKTFSQTYARLVEEMETLFEEKVVEIVSGTYTKHPQSGRGTYHGVKDLPDFPGGWDADIRDTLDWLQKEREKAAD